MKTPVEYEPIIRAVTVKRDWSNKICDLKVFPNWINDFQKKNCDVNDVKKVLKCLRRVKNYFYTNNNNESDSDSNSYNNYYTDYNFENTNNFPLDTQFIFNEFPYFNYEEIDEEYVNYMNNPLLQNTKIDHTLILQNLNNRHIYFNIDETKTTEILIREIDTQTEKVIHTFIPKLNTNINTNSNKKYTFYDVFSEYVNVTNNLIDEHVKKEFNNIINNCEEVDIQPWTNEEVINFFHPSLYPYIHGLTKVIKPLPKNRNPSPLFQWLATDVKIDYKENGDADITFLSTINNIPNDKLYNPIGKILGKLMPQFNNIFNKMLRKNYITYRNIDGSEYTEDIKLEKCQFIIKCQETVLHKDKKECIINDFNFSKEDIVPFDMEDAFWNWKSIKINNTKCKLTKSNIIYKIDKTIQEPIFCGMRIDEEFIIAKNLPNKVIEWMSNCGLTIDLTVFENTEFDKDKKFYEYDIICHKKSSLHLEGTHAERIIATGIYYFNSENIEPTDLTFKVQTDIDNFSEDYKQYLEKESVNELEKYKVVGNVETKEDMCIVFPNFLYHQVDDIVLSKNAESGKRKILVFWLVDPSTKIYSTNNVLPLKDKLSLEEAHVYREMLMMERKYVANTIDASESYEIEREYDEREYNLCEH